MMMKRLYLLLPGLLLALLAWAGGRLSLIAQPPQPAPLPTALTSGQALTPTPLFRYPVVTETIISGFFDHDPAPGSIVFFDERASSPDNGFLFSCPAVGNAWVGCEDSATSESDCLNEHELWYDNHKGIDFEYVLDWHTGDQCDLDKFEPVTITVYAPAAGIVDYVGENDPYNGNYIRLYHDLNDDGNFYNDGLRSYYLHFADDGIIVDEGDILAAGDPMGTGGATGLAWTPHLHFEVQQRTQVGWISVDPFGWQSEDDDPWYGPNHLLWAEEPTPSRVDAAIDPGGP
jgi:murein DD-endopeptidase MepM/ murein hydrolase activator NlpD